MVDLRCFLPLGNPLQTIQKSLVDPEDDGYAAVPSPKLLEYLKAAASLESVIVHGLSGASTIWSHFLTRHLYDPRLFLHIWAFTHCVASF